MSTTRTSLRVMRAACACAILLAASVPVSAQTSLRDKLDAVLAERATQLTGRSRVLIEFTSAPDVRVFRSDGIGRPIGARMYTGVVDNYALRRLAGDERIRRVMLDRDVVPTLERTGTGMGAVIARQSFLLSGKGVGIAIVDSGVASWHDDLYRPFSRGQTRVVPRFKDFTQPAGNVTTNETPYDDYGHGTHVAGTIGGNGYDSFGARSGMAPNAHILALKVLDGYGQGYISNVIAAIDYAISVKTTYNIRILNLSVASGVYESYHTDPLAQAAKRAVDAGIVVVAAAGNLGTDETGATQMGGITSPGNAPWVLTVGAASHNGTAVRSDDVIANFSSRGPTWIDFVAKPDILAPGVGVESLTGQSSWMHSTLPDYLLSSTRVTSYKPYLSLSGTSMAAPVVTGVIALMLEANPALTPNAVKAILQFTAQAHTAENPLAQGAGELNALGAVRLARYFHAPQNGVPVMSDVIAGETIPWARHLLWGNFLVTGGVPMPGSNAWRTDVTWGALSTAAGEPIVWGAHDADAENIVWSTNEDGNIVWSTTDDAENIVWSTGDADDENIVWSTDGGDDGNIVWSTSDDENIVWSTATARNVVWGNDCGGRNCRQVIWGAQSDGRVWGTADDDENIVWSTTDDNENIVWSTDDDENIVWSTAPAGNVLWPASSR